jgi:hypothetical protein
MEPTIEANSVQARPAGFPRAEWRLADAVHYASLLVAFAVVLYLDRHRQFASDEWDFLASRGEGGRSLQLFVPHGDHWSTIPILLYRGLYALFGVRTHLPYEALLVASHVVVAHLIWRWLRRLGMHPWVSTLVVGVFLILGSGADELSWAFQISWTLPLALGLAGAMLVDHSQRGIVRDLLYWPIGIAALMCSGVGVSMVVLAALLTLLRRGWQAALRVASVPAFTYLVWFILIGHRHPAIPGPTLDQLLTVPRFVWAGLTASIDNTTGWIGAGAVIILTLAALLYWRRADVGGQRSFIVAAAGTAVAFFTIAGIGRVALGVAQAGANRYIYIAIALLIPTIALGLSRIAWQSVAGVAVCATVCAVVAVNCLGELRAVIERSVPLEEQSFNQILAAAALLQSHAQLAVAEDAQPDPVLSPDVSVGELRALLGDGALPIDRAIPDDARVAAALHLELSLTATPNIATGTRPRTISGNVPVVVGADGCASLVSATGFPTLNLAYAAPSSIRISPSAAGSVTITLTEGQPGTSASEMLPVNTGSTYFLNVTAVDSVSGTARVQIVLPAGVSTVCGISS